MPPHLGIVVVLGLVSSGFVMIGLLIAVRPAVTDDVPGTMEAEDATTHL